MNDIWQMVIKVARVAHGDISRGEAIRLVDDIILHDKHPS